jgi:homoserine O-acetyltransferase/O-succinyltransferase
MEQAYIGPGRAIDPDKYFVIIANQMAKGSPVRPITRLLRSMV